MADKNNQNKEVPILLSYSNPDDLTSEDSNSRQNETSQMQKEEKICSEVEALSLKISNVIADLANELTSLKQVVEERLCYDKVKEEAFDRLYKELDEFKKNNIFNRNRPLYIDIILFFDRIENIYNGIDKSNSLSAEFKLILKTLTDELLEMLYRQGIEIIIPLSKGFDPTIQRAIGTEQTSIEGENNQIARVVRKGFRYGDHILRAGEVIVMKYKEIMP